MGKSVHGREDEEGGQAGIQYDLSVKACSESPSEAVILAVTTSRRRD